MARTIARAPWWRPLACFLLIAGLTPLAGCLPQTPPPEAVAPVDASAAPADLARRCAEFVGPPRVERISEHVWAAIGHDLANTVVIRTDEGLVVVDSGLCLERARMAQEALKKVVPWGPVKALIYTHSHADHVGGAAQWAPPGVPIWSTEALPGHLLKQYARFLRAEMARGMRQLGEHVPLAALPCSALGNRGGVGQARTSGLLLPTHTFSKRHTLTVGGVELVLIEAPGETHDQLIVWLPGERTLVAADDFYWTFPNLYTIRGASPRPVDGWIKSLDMMRSLRPEHLIPCHTKPMHGEREINQALTDYRDAIQWVRDEVVRRANRGQDLDSIAEEVKLPPRLAGKPYLLETYGQVDWSARAIYVNNLGWFDGRAERLYPTPAREAAAREVELMGGPALVLGLARQALQDGDPRWAAHLLAKLGDARLEGGPAAAELNELMARALTDQAEGAINTNGRAYLLEYAYELRHGPQGAQRPRLPDRMVNSLPMDDVLDMMTTRLDPAAACQVHGSLVLDFSDLGRRYVLTVRWGVAEVAVGEPLPGTPTPVATLTMTASDFRRLILGLEGPLALRAAGRIQVEGSWLEALGLLRLFRGPVSGNSNG